MITVDELINAMRKLLTNFNDEGVTISEDTVHNEVLSSEDGFGQASSKVIYKSSVDWIIWRNGGKKRKKWQSNWMEKTVREVAEKLLS